MDEYKPLAQRILSRFGEEANTKVRIKQIAYPNLSKALKVGRREAFSLFNPRHSEAARHLSEIFLGTN